MKLAVSAAVSVFLIYAQDARTLLTGGSTDERIGAVERQLRQSPGSSKLQTSLIALYLQKLRETADGSYLDRASRLVDRLIEQDGGSFDTLRLRNEIDLQRHDFVTVAERARAMTKDKPSDPGVWGNLGDALMELGEYEQAGEAYRKMFALGPNMASYNRLGNFRFVTGDAQDAIRWMRLAAEVGDEVPEHRAWCEAELGDLYFKTGHPEEARSSYQAALDLWPQLHRAYAGLGRLDSAAGQTEAAIRDYERAQAMVPLVEYAGALEDLYRKMGRDQKADGELRLIDTIDALDKARGELTNRTLALIMANEGRHLDRALELIEAEIPGRGDVYTWDVYSWVLFRAGRLKEARSASLKALRMSTPEPDFYRHAARIAEAAGEAAAAAQYLEHLRQ